MFPMYSQKTKKKNKTKKPTLNQMISSSKILIYSSQSSSKLY